MGALQMILQIAILIVALKAIIGFHWPWEPIVNAKRSLQQNLESIKGSIPTATYKSMRESISRIC